MGKKASSPDNQQGSKQIKRYLLCPSETTRQIPQMSRELAILLGILFTDGCISPKRVNSWRIYFVNKSKILIGLFQNCMSKVFDLDVRRVRIGKTSDNFIKAIVNSKQIGNYLVNRFGTFRTLRFKNGKLPKVRLPVSQLLKSGYLVDFLRVVFSCDGGLSFYPAYRAGAAGGTKWLIRTVFLSCKHPKLRTDYTNLLKALGIEARNVPGDGKIKIETERNIKKFYELVGFVKGVEITNQSKFWRGYEKQHVLKLMVSSYGNPSKIYNLPKFHLR